MPAISSNVKQSQELLQVTAAMAVDRKFVNIVLTRRHFNGDPKLPNSTRLSPKPLKSMLATPRRLPKST